MNSQVYAPVAGSSRRVISCNPMKLLPVGQNSCACRPLATAVNFLDTKPADALVWGRQQGSAPPPPVAMPEGVNNSMAGPLRKRGAIFLEDQITQR